MKYLIIFVTSVITHVKTEYPILYSRDRRICI